MKIEKTNIKLKIKTITTQSSEKPPKDYYIRMGKNKKQIILWYKCITNVTDTLRKKEKKCIRNKKNVSEIIIVILIMRFWLQSIYYEKIIYSFIYSIQHKIESMRSVI